MIRRLISRLLCVLGLHGPNVFGPMSGHRSRHTVGYERRCTRCHAVWHGREVETRNGPSSGNWRRVN